MESQSFTALFLIAIAASVALQSWLAHRQVAHVKAHRGSVPCQFRDHITKDTHHKAADYTVAKTRFSLWELVFENVVLLGLTLGGGLGLLSGIWEQWDVGPAATGAGVLVSLFLLVGILNAPLSAYELFVIEHRFGFNNASPGLFLADTVKEGLLLIILGTPLALLAVWLMNHAGTLWWLHVWLVWMGFALAMMWLFPAFVAPLFNRFEPLENPELVSRIQRLLTRCGFQSGGIFVMDGSRRSGHGNAYFTGLGSKKRIVFYDTLLNTLDPDEIEAVLAHELGHFKRRHVGKRLIMVSAFSLAGLAALGWLSAQPGFYTGLGLEGPSAHGALALFLLISPVLGSFMQPLTARTLRRHEFEADDFAAEQTDPKRLIQALVKLYEENAATLTPDPLYSAFHDSHPPAPVRVANLTARAVAN